MIYGQRQAIVRVYPHVCGAARPGHPLACPSKGLSPRVWGSLTKKPARTISGRSIPTCVGQPKVSIDIVSIAKVYPHVCGAADNIVRATQIGQGLSPRVWGSLGEMYGEEGRSWSIPTCVGQPPASTAYRATTTVYPHVCGAAVGRPALVEIVSGLSPRVWGSRLGTLSLRSSTRSIPTCVGQPPPPHSASCPVQVYPHVCGAAILVIIKQPAVWGLSPRVWGSPTGRPGHGQTTRSIPTCVGQPAGLSKNLSLFRVYPHVCGAALSMICCVPCEVGLSPRVWGSLIRLPCSMDRCWSIPTCVGQPQIEWLRDGSIEVYPHVCGAATVSIVVPQYS